MMNEWNLVDWRRILVAMGSSIVKLVFGIVLEYFIGRKYSSKSSKRVRRPFENFYILRNKSKVKKYSR